MCTGNPYIGVPGVSNHKGLETVLRKLKEQGLKRVYECYDMDKMMELSCKHDEKSACRQCEWRMPQKAQKAGHDPKRLYKTI